MHISKLERGNRIRIEKSFDDFDGRTWKRGQELIYAEQSYFFYDGGYALIFDRGVMRLAEVVDENARVIRNDKEEYFKVCREEGDLQSPPGW